MKNDAEQSRAMEPLVGNMWIPTWASRPGSYKTLIPYAPAMPLWVLIHSRSGDVYMPCIQNREQFGATLLYGRAKVSRHLKSLRDAALLFEVNRGREPKTQKNRPPARWALDPFSVDVWREKVPGALERLAEDDGQNGRWFHNATTALEAFERKNQIRGAHIGEDMPFLSKKPRKKRQSKGRKDRYLKGRGPK